MNTINIEIDSDLCFLNELIETIIKERRMQAKNMFKNADDPCCNLFDWGNYHSYGLLLSELADKVIGIEKTIET